MEIVIVRHGKAVDISEDGDDFSRALSKKGKDASKEAALSLKKAGFKPNLILSSPLKRAVETAEIFSGVFEGCEIVSLDILRPNNSVQQAFEYIQSYLDKNLIIIGHMPFISQLSYLFLQKDIYFNTSSYIYLKKIGEGFEIVSQYNL